MSSKEEVVLIIGRGKLLQNYFQGLINVFSKNYKILLIDGDKEVNYYGDYLDLDLDLDLDKKNHMDSDFLKKINDIEKSINLNLYESYSDYFYYGRLAQEANISYKDYWKDRDWIANRFFNSYVLFTDIIKKYELRFVLYDSIDQIHSKVLEALSKKYKFGFYHTWIASNIFDNRIILSYGIHRKSKLYEYELNSFDCSLITEEEKYFLEATFERFKNKQPKLEILDSVSQKVITFKEIKRIFINFKNIKYGVKRFFNRIWLKKTTKNFNLKNCGDYILFFMSHQPEATTTSAAQKYVDQWKIVEDLAVNAPSNINIVIKAHPFGYGWQGEEYYEKLVRLPNVFMAPINYDGKELIKNSKVVLTINGSIGLEAMMYNVPAYTIGNAWYSHPNYIENLDTHLDLLNRLDSLKILTKEEKEAVLVSAYRSSVDFFINYDIDSYKKKKIASGENLAEHILKYEDIYFTRVDIAVKT